MTASYEDPFSDVQSPHDDSDLIAPFPIATAQPAPRPPLRVRMADAADDALRSPRWDQVRGLVLLGSVAFISTLLALLFLLVVITGVVVVVQTVWEAL